MASFRTRARAVDLLGRQQIASLPTALSELFKNSHDAYATFARADYYRVQNLLAVTDDGLGMDRKTFETSWLTIATESKVDNTELEPPLGMAKRTQQGEKGIGRFAIGALGSQVLVVSKRQGSRTIAAFVNWEMFALPHVDLEDVPVALLELGEDGLVPADVNQLRDPLDRAIDSFRRRDASIKWQERLDRIQAQVDAIPDDPYGSLRETEPLSGSGSHFFITPVSDDFLHDLEGSADDRRSSPIEQTLHGFTDRWLGSDSKCDPQFTVRFFDHHPGGDTQSLLEPSEFFRHEDFGRADHHIEGRFDALGKFTGTIRVFDAEKLKVEISPPFQSKPLCGSFKFTLGVVQGLQRESRLEPGAFSEKTKKLNHLGGVYVYLDGIRMQPYGRPDVDYLEIEERRSRGAAYYYFSYRRMFGAVSLTSKDNKNLEEKAGREGFTKGLAYSHFRRLLINLFQELAARFFRTTAPQADAYQQGRERLKHEGRTRRERQRRMTRQRNEMGKTLARVVHYIETTDFVSKAYKTVQEAQDHLEAARRLQPAMQHVSAARIKLAELLEPLRLEEPEGFALTTPMRLDFAFVETSLAHLKESTIKPALKELEGLAAAAETRLTIVEADISMKHRFVNRKLQWANSEVSKEVGAARNSLQSLHRKAETAINREHLSFQQALEALPQPDLTSTTGWFEFQADFESEVEELVRRSLRALRRISTQIKTSHLVYDPKAIAPADLAAAADAEILDLRERADAELEFVQLGKALAVVDHEFRATVSSIRSDIRKLRSWANLNPRLRPLYEDLRRDFDHLDSYLTLLTPLQRRVPRAKTIIKGFYIRRFLIELFRARLQEVNAEIIVTTSFREMKMEGYVSTFYPVFINLVDNSLYWFAQERTSSKNKIELDARDGVIIYSDTGPGIPSIIIDRVFEFGFTTRPGGSGLGLAIAKQVLDRAGWSIELTGHNNGVRFLIAPKKGKP